MKYSLGFGVKPEATITIQFSHVSWILSTEDPLNEHSLVVSKSMHACMPDLNSTRVRARDNTTRVSATERWALYIHIYLDEIQ